MNVSEQAVKTHLESLGNAVLSRGWPDFLCLRKDRDREGVFAEDRFSGVFAVEVKYGKDKVRPEQEIIHAVLRKVGIPCHVVRPDRLSSKNLASTCPKTFLTHGELLNLGNRVKQLEASAQRNLDAAKEIRGLIAGASVYMEEVEKTHEVFIDGPSWANETTFSVQAISNALSAGALKR